MKNLLSKTLLLFIILIELAAIDLAQSTKKDRPKIKDFGSSLKKKTDKSGKKDEKSDTLSEVIRVETTLVVNDVLVLDEKGNYVKGLKKDDFIITEDGKPQEIETLSLGDDAAIPRSIVLIIDYSVSEREYINNSVEAAKVLIDSLKDNDRLAIVTDNVELLCDFTADKQFLKEKLESLRLRVIGGQFGHSEQYRALIASLNELFSTEDIRRIVIFQTDGDRATDTAQKFNFDEVTKAIEKSHATIYSVLPEPRYLGLSEGEQYRRSKIYFQTLIDNYLRTNSDLMHKPGPFNNKDISKFLEMVTKRQAVMTQTAEYSGGWTDYIETPSQANQVYSKILEGIANRYVIGYYPQNTLKDGKRRIIKVEVRHHPEYQIEGQKIYYPVESEN